MSGLTQTAAAWLKNLSKSPAQKTLEEAGVIDSCGDVTTDGRRFIVRYFLEENKDAIVAKLQEMQAEAEAKAAKKAK